MTLAHRLVPKVNKQQCLIGSCSVLLTMIAVMNSGVLWVAWFWVSLSVGVVLWIWSHLWVMGVIAAMVKDADLSRLWMPIVFLVQSANESPSIYDKIWYRFV